MCFNANSEWYAEVEEEGTSHLSTPTTCDECSRTIPPATLFHDICLQEHEECRNCDSGYCECPRDEDGYCRGCECSDPDYGETFDWRCCDECYKFLQAVESVEKEEGCTVGTKPRLLEMVDSIQDLDEEYIEKYLGRACQMFPTTSFLYLRKKLIYEDE